MKKLIFPIAISLFLGCSGSSGVPIDTNTTKRSTQKKPITYKHQEWHFIYDKNFFQFNKIDRDAHIHASDSTKKYSGKGVTIAVIDDSLDVSHPDIRDAIIKTYNVEDNSTIVTPKKDESHGTAVVGIISARDGKVRGIAPDAKIIFIAVPEVLTDSAVVKAFDYAEKNHADIISCSWGTNSVSDIVKDKIKEVAHNA